jgi:hypothetical protein
MTHAEAIAEAERRQASDPGASWIATSRDGEWTVVCIVKPELSPLPTTAWRAARSRSSSLSSGIWGWASPGGLW